MEDEIDVTEAFKAGIKANRQNKSIHDNPYHGIHERRAWREGWVENQHCDDE